MRYHLVLQFKEPTVPTVDALAALEDELARQLPSGDEVDGHDSGTGEANVFIVTQDARRAFAAVTPTLHKQQLLDTVAVAYRAENSDEYVRLWPLGGQEPFRIL